MSTYINILDSEAHHFEACRVLHGEVEVGHTGLHDLMLTGQHCRD
jgi:hypothetical protein